MSKFIIGLTLIFGVTSICQVAFCDEGVEFENKNQKRQYERVLKRIKSLKPAGGDQAKADDWFVVGGAVGDDVNIDKYQGEKEVALRISRFIVKTRNKGQWRIYNRASDSEMAQEQLAAAKRDYVNWRQAEYNRLVANEIVRRSNVQYSYNPYPGRSYVMGYASPGWGGFSSMSNGSVSFGQAGPPRTGGPIMANG